MRRPANYLLLMALLLMGCADQKTTPDAESPDAADQRAAEQPTDEAADVEAGANQLARKEEKAGDLPRTVGRGREKIAKAVAVLEPVGDSGVRGTIHFTQEGDTVQIRGNIKGLSPGKHGFHVHEYGDLTDQETGKSAGGHYAPLDNPHGRPEDEKRHVGDLGNIEAGDDGTAEVQLEDVVIQLNGPHAIVGRALVVHAGEDQFTQPSGDAGDRVAFGVIGIAKPE